jgi:hypothetical protein
VTTVQDDIHIPKTALEAGELAYWGKQDSGDDLRKRLIAAFNAMVKAWPGMKSEHLSSWVMDGPDLPYVEETPRHHPPPPAGEDRMTISIQRDIDAIAQSIPDEYLLDPPDGGDVTLAEGVQRMADRIQQLEVALRNVCGHIKGGTDASGRYVQFINKYEALSAVENMFALLENRAALGEKHE